MRDYYTEPASSESQLMGVGGRFDRLGTIQRAYDYHLGQARAILIDICQLAGIMLKDMADAELKASKLTEED